MSTNLSNAARFFSDSDLKKIKSMNKKARDLLRDNVRSHWWNISRYSIICDLIKSLRLPMNSRVLELGVGTGDLISALAFSFKIGIDSFRYNQPYHGFKFIQGDINFLPLKKESMDLLLLLDVLEHIQDDNRVITDCFGLVKEKGKIIICVPAFKILWSDWDKANLHFRRYSRKALINILKESKVKYRIIKSSYINFSFFPFILIIRVMQRVVKSLMINYDSSATKKPINMVNNIFTFIFSSERYLLRHISFPLGSSYLCVLEKR